MKHTDHVAEDQRILQVGNTPADATTSLEITRTTPGITRAEQIVQNAEAEGQDIAAGTCDGAGRGPEPGHGHEVVIGTSSGASLEATAGEAGCPAQAVGHEDGGRDHELALTS